MKALKIKRLETKEDCDNAFQIMTGWSVSEVERCKYDPKKDVVRETPGAPGCKNKATVIVGTKEQLWLCDACAGMPRFKRHKNLGPIFPWRTN